MQLKAVVWSCDVNGYVGLGTLWLVRHQLEFVGHSAELGKRTACREWNEHGAVGVWIGRKRVLSRGIIEKRGASSKGEVRPHDRPHESSSCTSSHTSSLGTQIRLL
jgi:hypothetical protein